MENLLRIPATEMLATMEKLGKYGVTAADFKRIRRDSAFAEHIAATMKDTTGARATIPYQYPPQYLQNPVSIKKQVARLLKFERFSELDASWVLEHGQSWYESFDSPEWVEGPLVYVKPAAQLTLDDENSSYCPLHTIIEEYSEFGGFNIPRTGSAPSYTQYHSSETTLLESVIGEVQNGDFFVVPSQAGKRWAGYSPKSVKHAFQTREFGLSLLAECCRAITHPLRYKASNQSSVICLASSLSTTDSGKGYPVLDRDRRDAWIGSEHIWLSDNLGHAGASSGFCPL